MKRVPDEYEAHMEKKNASYSMKCIGVCCPIRCYRIK